MGLSGVEIALVILVSSDQQVIEPVAVDVACGGYRHATPVIRGFTDEPPTVLAVRGLASWLEKAQDQGLVRSGSMHGVSRAIFGSMHMECFTSHLQAGTVDREQALGMLRSVIDSLWPGLRPDAQESN